MNQKMIIAVIAFAGFISSVSAEAQTAFYVATDGSDSNPGTLSEPFASLAEAQIAMRNSDTKTTYIRAGNYSPRSVACASGSTHNCGINLTSEDNGETWSYYEPDGVDSASISGGSTTQSNGLWIVFHADGTSNVTISGLTIHNFRYAGVSANGDSYLTVENNIIYNGYYVPGSASSPAGITCYSCENLTTSHNVIHNIAGFGINNTEAGGVISNWTAAFNVVYLTCTGLQDCGALYGQDLNQTSKNISWINNYIRDANTSAGQNSSLGEALYFDDCLSNVTATGNVISGNNGSNTIFYHAGNNLNVSGNLVDLSTFGAPIASWGNSSGGACSNNGAGNSFKNNIVISAGAGGGYTEDEMVSKPAITSNAYHNYSTGSLSARGSYSDATPVVENPELSGWTYTIQAGSPVFSSPVDFHSISTGWGPPGYTIPETGTPPSSPH